ncbi:sulfur carrier protein ThiS [Terriglobus tenax]|uniref:sulfur carrier protein ThiS n=1 Tax=Terriglobus tenax TaxID=1111115 RepID=UPI0021DF8628|nr:sulfur carrier protein ThiS [Terriglobus tenax]
MALTLELNGQRREFGALDEGVALDQVVAELGLKLDRVAVELNGDIVRRTAWAETSLKDGDKLEVVHFVGGGSNPIHVRSSDTGGRSR